MDLEQAIQSRRAAREYLDESIGRPVLQKLIEAAIQAPSAVNEQSWLFAVVQDRGLLALICREAKAQLLSAHELRHDPAFDIFYGAPVLIVISSATRSRWAVENCALAAQNLMLAARAEGLGTCWIGLSQGWLATIEGKAALGLPAACLPVAPIIVGRPKSPPALVPRKEPQIQWIGP